MRLPCLLRKCGGYRVTSLSEISQREAAYSFMWPPCTRLESTPPQPPSHLAFVVVGALSYFLSFFLPSLVRRILPVLSQQTPPPLRRKLQFVLPSFASSLRSFPQSLIPPPPFRKIGAPLSLRVVFYGERPRRPFAAPIKMRVIARPPSVGREEGGRLQERKSWMVSRTPRTKNIVSVSPSSSLGQSHSRFILESGSLRGRIGSITIY